MGRGIELMGFPCAGKTYYANQQRPYIETVKADERVLVLRIYLMGIEMTRNPRLLFLSVLSLREVSVRNMLMQLKAIFRLFSRLAEERARLHLDVIVEEGVLQAFWGLLMLMDYNQRSRTIFYRMTRVIPFYRPTLCYIAATWENILYRNLSRAKKTRFSNLLERKNNLKEVRNCRLWMSVLLRFYKERVSEVTYIRIDNIILDTSTQ